MKKALIVTTVASMIDQFNMNNIKILKELGFCVDVACNFENGSTCSKERIEYLKQTLQSEGVNYYQIDFPRKPTNIKSDLVAYKQIKKIITNGNYSLVHCHAPVAAACTRIACKPLRKNGLKVIYTCHGYHFFKGGPVSSWIIFYPIEWICARWTDVLININKEDYALSKKHMHAKRIEYVPGVGIDVAKFANTVVDKAAKRKELDVPEDAFMILSVGELNKNKNHEAVLREMHELLHSENPKVELLKGIDSKNLHYCVAGVGQLHDYLLEKAKELGLEEKFHLLGFRTDCNELYKTADLYVLPSLREGLNVSLQEAKAAGCELRAYQIRSNDDVLNNDIKTFDSVNIRKDIKRIYGVE